MALRPARPGNTPSLLKIVADDKAEPPFLLLCDVNDTIRIRVEVARHQDSAACSHAATVLREMLQPILVSLPSSTDASAAALAALLTPAGAALGEPLQPAAADNEPSLAERLQKPDFHAPMDIGGSGPKAVPQTSADGSFTNGSSSPSLATSTQPAAGWGLVAAAAAGAPAAGWEPPKARSPWARVPSASLSAPAASFAAVAGAATAGVAAREAVASAATAQAETAAQAKAKAAQMKAKAAAAKAAAAAAAANAAKAKAKAAAVKEKHSSRAPPASPVLATTVPAAALAPTAASVPAAGAAPRAAPAATMNLVQPEGDGSPMMRRGPSLSTATLPTVEQQERTTSPAARLAPSAAARNDDDADEREDRYAAGELADRPPSTRRQLSLSDRRNLSTPPQSVPEVLRHWSPNPLSFFLGGGGFFGVEPAPTEAEQPPLAAAAASNASAASGGDPEARAPSAAPDPPPPDGALPAQRSQRSQRSASTSSRSSGTPSSRRAGGPAIASSRPKHKKDKHKHKHKPGHHHSADVETKRKIQALEAELAAHQPIVLLQARRANLKDSGFAQRFLTEPEPRASIVEEPLSERDYRDPADEHFSLADVRSRRVDGLNPQRLEAYLDDADFRTATGYTREQFYSFKPWKQTAIKEERHLF